MPCILYDTRIRHIASVGAVLRKDIIERSIELVKSLKKVDNVEKFMQ